MFGDNGDPTSFLCGRCNIFDASEKFLFCLCGRRNIFDAFEKFPVTLLPFCVAGAIIFSPHPKTPVP